MSERTGGGAWRLDLDAGARRVEGGRTLIGGSPLRILRFSERGRRWLDGVEAGAPVPAGEASTALSRRLVDGGLAHPIPPPGSGPTTADVTLVVPVKDGAEDLGRAIATAGPVGAVVVVDDGSADPGAVTTGAGPGAMVLRHERSLGPAAAREAGWRSTTTPFLAFVDADTAATTGWLERLLPHFVDPTVGAVAPRVRSTAGAAPGWLARYEAARSPLDLGPRPAAIRPGSRVPYVPTAALVVRREALEAVGGFEPALRVGEDVDLVWRLHRAGWRLRYEPAAVVDHPARPDLREWMRQRFTYGTSAAVLAARHGRAVAPLTGVSGWSALAWGAVVAGHPIAGAAVATATTAALVPKLHALDDPAGEAVRIAGAGNLWAGRAVADALRRAWWPLTALLAVVRRRSRPAIAAAVVVPPLLEWRATRPALDPVRYAALRLLDDVAYGTGVWAGCLRARSGRALVPAFSGPLPPPSDAEPGPHPESAVATGA